MGAPFFCFESEEVLVAKHKTSSLVEDDVAGLGDDDPGRTSLERERGIENLIERQRGSPIWKDSLSLCVRE